MPSMGPAAISMGGDTRSLASPPPRASPLGFSIPAPNVISIKGLRYKVTDCHSVQSLVGLLLICHKHACKWPLCILCSKLLYGCHRWDPLPYRWVGSSFTATAHLASRLSASRS